jgi:hypothetical protein
LTNGYTAAFLRSLTSARLEVRVWTYCTVLDESREAGVVMVADVSHARVSAYSRNDASSVGSGSMRCTRLIMDVSSSMGLLTLSNARRR